MKVPVRRGSLIVGLFVAGLMIGVVVYAAWTQTHTININGLGPVVPAYVTNPSFSLTAGVTNGVAQSSLGFTTGQAGSGTVAFTNSTTGITSMTLVLLNSGSCPSTAPAQSATAPVMVGSATGSTPVPFSLPAGTAYTYCLYYSSDPTTPTGHISVVYTGTNP